ncbi:hypothetical protein ACFX1Z_037768 [Malus domestica]
MKVFQLMRALIQPPKLLSSTAEHRSDITLSSSDHGSGLDTLREFGSRVPSNFLSSSGHSSPQYNIILLFIPEDQPMTTISGHNGHGLQVQNMEQVDMSELELQTLRRQMVKESKRGQDLSREAINLKEERDSSKAEVEKLKSFQKRMDGAKIKNRFQLEGGDLRALVEEIRQELSYEKDLSFNLRLLLQKTQESNSDLILLVRDLEEILEQKNSEIGNLSSCPESCWDAAGLKATISKGGTREDEEQLELEDLVKEHSNAKKAHLLEKQIAELYVENLK